MTSQPWQNEQSSGKFPIIYESWFWYARSMSHGHLRGNYHEIITKLSYMYGHSRGKISPPITSMVKVTEL